MPFDSHSHRCASTRYVDPITQAVMDGGAGDPPDAGTLESADALCGAHLQTGTASAGLQAMLGLVRQHPGCERLQVLAARMLDRASGRDRAIPAWFALSARFPSCQEAFLLTLRWTLRMEGEAAARKVIAARFPMQPDTTEGLLLRARAWDELGAIHEATADFNTAFGLDPSCEMAPVLHARMLERRGDRQGARQVLSMALRQVGPVQRLSAEFERLDADLRRLEALPALPSGASSDASSRVLAYLLQEAIRRRGTPELRRGALGSVILVNGCLGAGGAERQLVNTAIGLQRARQAGMTLAGHRLDGPVEVVCRSLDDRPGADFFLPALRNHGVQVSRYDRFAAFGGDRARSVVAEWRDLLHFLPPRVVEGTTRLADAIRARAPSVVHLWQDGTILAGALAALLAGVPRIVLSVRGAPPPDRPERDRPEYAVLYPLLMQAPGVVMMANSRFAARRYAEWIGLPQERVTVAPNGLSMPAAEALGTSQALMDAFTARTGPGFTVGGVMRFVENKRPLPWIDCAAKVLAHRPDARFIIVGDGELRDGAEARARSLGIADRILFAGRRPDVGFWMHQFDAFLLLSRTEGLPNVLIEAQAAGVPVVTTPAGGAAETLLQGETGWVLGSASAPDLDEAAARIVALAGSYSLERSERARRFVTDRFSLARMIEQTMEAYVA